MDYVAHAELFFSATLRARFDIVGLDPRGMRHSTALDCSDIPLWTPTTTLFPRTPQQFDELRRHNRAVGLTCLKHGGPLARNLDTVNVARDHEALRIALGVRRVNWLGISYGTQLAINYADLYPGRTRAMVFDSALEHSGSEVTMQAEIVTVETSFNRFVQWCATAPTCALRGQDVAAVYDRLVAAADRNPRALEAAIAGNAAAFALPDIQGPNPYFAIAANGCSDYVSEIRTFDEMRQRIQLGRQLAPHLQGASELWQVVGCIGWPIRASNPPRRLDVRGVPTLIVNATHDPSTSYKWAYGLAAQIEGSDILTRVGDGHTSYYTSACARAATDQFLITRQAAPDGVCTS